MLIAPSAICSIEFAWPALTTACLRPWTSAFMREPIAIEAASSRAETTRLPIDSLDSDPVASMSVLTRLRWATLAAWLETTFNGMLGLPACGCWTGGDLPPGAPWGSGAPLGRKSRASQG